MIHLILGAPRAARDELLLVLEVVKTRERYADVLWDARYEKQGIAPASRSGPCERTMGYMPTAEESRVRVDKLPPKLRSIAS